MNLNTPLPIKRAIIVSIDKNAVIEKALLKLTHTIEVLINSMRLWLLSTYISSIALVPIKSFTYRSYTQRNYKTGH